MPNNEGVSIAKKSSSIAAQSLLLGMHLAVNSKMLSMLSNHETGASSVVSTFQTVIIGTAGGFLQATGLEIGSPIAKNKLQKAGHLAKSSFILALGLGSLSSGLMLISPSVFEHLSSEEASKIAADFFKGYAAAGIPSMLILSSPQIAFQAGEWYLPIASGAIFYIPAGILSYLLAFPAGMGALGIGLGGSIGGWLSTFFFQSWLYQKKYDEYQLYNLPALLSK